MSSLVNLQYCFPIVKEKCLTDRFDAASHNCPGNNIFNDKCITYFFRLKISQSVTPFGGSGRSSFFWGWWSRGRLRKRRPRGVRLEFVVPRTNKWYWFGEQRWDMASRTLMSRHQQLEPVRNSMLRSRRIVLYFRMLLSINLWMNARRTFTSTQFYEL